MSSLRPALKGCKSFRRRERSDQYVENFKTDAGDSDLGLSSKPALAQLPDDFKGEVEQNSMQLPDDFSAEVGHRIIHTPNSGLDIDVWINRAEGSTYYPGEDIRSISGPPGIVTW